MSSSYRGYWINGDRETGYTAMKHDADAPLPIAKQPTLAAIKRTIDGIVAIKTGDAVKFKDSTGDWAPGVAITGLVELEYGNCGYYVNAGNGRKVVAYKGYIKKA